MGALAYKLIMIVGLQLTASMDHGAFNREPDLFVLSRVCGLWLTLALAVIRAEALQSHHSQPHPSIGSTPGLRLRSPPMSPS